MKSDLPISAVSTEAEIAALIATLHRAEARLEELTAGEVDSVSDQDGRTFLLRHAQDQLRASDAAKQASILDALAANIALLDGRGFVLSVNESWRQFARDNAFSGLDHGIGLNYLELCEHSGGARSDQDPAVAAGIRAVLAGTQSSFSIEYPCHSPTEQRWFLLNVTPLDPKRQIGAVVMHQNITERKQAATALQKSEAEFHILAESMPQIVWITQADGQNIYFNRHWVEYTGLTLEQSRGHGWRMAFHPDDRRQSEDAWTCVLETLGTYSTEVRLRRADGIYRWWLVRGVAVTDADGTPLRWFGTCTDIDELKMAGLEISRANKAFKASERRFTEMLDNVDLVSLMLDCDGRITYCNDYLLDITGWKREEVFGRNWFEVFMPDQRAAEEQRHFALLEGNQAMLHQENEIQTRSGARRLVRWNNAVLRSPTGEAIGSASIGEDITDRREAEARITYLNRILAMLSGINTLIVHAKDCAELYQSACRIAVETGGFRMAVLCLMNPDDLKLSPVAAAGEDDELLATVKRVLNSDAQAQNTMIMRAMREAKIVISNDAQSDTQMQDLFRNQYLQSGIRSVAFLPLMAVDESIGVLALYAGEIAFFHREEMKILADVAADIGYAMSNIGNRERLDYLAFYDDLTGLANRTLFLERLSQTLKVAGVSHRQVAVSVFDLQRFASINHELGRSAGDELLRQVAKRMADVADDSTQLARLNADQYAIASAETETVLQMAKLVEQIFAAVFDPPYTIGGELLTVGARCGIAIFPSDGSESEALLGSATNALIRAQSSGERYMFFEDEMALQVAGTFALENRLRQALERDEFVLHYQPKFDIETRLIVGVEALIRWQSPENGLIFPNRFVPLLEQTGLILQVGQWALSRAAVDHRRWLELGLQAPRIAVNVSQVQMRQRDFAKVMESALSVGVSPVGIDIEITESLLMEDVDNSIRKLEAVRRLGMCIAIDDFGTGYSSLAVLARLPVDTLKIDYTFITKMLEHPDSMTLVQTIISLAHTLRLKVVAEGVESEEQAKILRLLRCDQMQGYLLSKAVPFENIVAMLQHSG